MFKNVTQGYPGLAQEAAHICELIGIPDVCLGGVSRGEVKAAISSHHQVTLKEEMKGLVKCDELIKCDLSKPQPYFLTKCLAQARMGFRIQTRMLVCPGNMKQKFQGRMGCEACLAWREEGEGEVVATQSHLQQCPVFATFRVGRDIELNFDDLIRYFVDVMLVTST